MINIFLIKVHSKLEKKHKEWKHSVMKVLATMENKNHNLMTILWTFLTRVNAS